MQQRGQFIYVELVFPRKSGSYVELGEGNCGKGTGQLNISNIMLSQQSTIFFLASQCRKRQQESCCPFLTIDFSAITKPELVNRLYVFWEK